MKVLNEIKTNMKHDTTLVAVSKYRSIADIAYLANLGVCDFGENRVQELITKASQRPDLNWHLIGQLQTNKAGAAVQYAKLIHSLDREKLAQALQKEASKQNKIINVLVQVNISLEESKAGFRVEEVMPFLHTIEKYPNIHVVGLMCMGPNTQDEKRIREVFREAKNLFGKIKTEIVSSQITMEILSMGMSSDYVIALEEGSNMIRIGSLLFEHIPQQ